MRIHSAVKLLGGALALSAGMQQPAQAQDFQRGQALFEVQCQGCHGDPKTFDTDRKVKTVVELRKRIAAWAGHAGTEWGEGEVEDVLLFMNKSFYHLQEGGL